MTAPVFSCRSIFNIDCLSVLENLVSLTYDYLDAESIALCGKLPPGLFVCFRRRWCAMAPMLIATAAAHHAGLTSLVLRPQDMLSHLPCLPPGLSELTALRVLSIEGLEYVHSVDGLTLLTNLEVPPSTVAVESRCACMVGALLNRASCPHCSNCACL